MEKFSYLVLILLFTTQTQVFAQQKSFTWYSMEEAQQKASEEQKKVLVYAEAQWCGYCKKMNNNVFPKQAVQDSILKYYYPVRIDVESDKKMQFNGETMTQRQFSGKHAIRATPTMFFIDADGKIIGKQPGYIPADIFGKLLSFVGTDSFGEIAFEDYLNND